MRWQRGHRSGSVDDRRGQRSPGGPGGMSGIGALLLGRVLARFGLPGILLFVAILVCGSLLQGQVGVVDDPAGAPRTAQGTDDAASFVGFVLDDNQAVWQQQFAARGARYEPATLVLFTDSTPTACGYGSAATGPFYCPIDEQVYIDLGFYDQLSARFGAPGDFAQAYVIAHEIGHHVQHQLGLMPARPEAGAAGSSVRVELQADCLAGVWARSAQQRGLVEPGDLEEGIRAAAAIGDDRLQSRAGGRVTPESWTHGSSAERVQSFRRGYQGGELAACEAAPIAP